MRSSPPYQAPRSPLPRALTRPKDSSARSCSTVAPAARQSSSRVNWASEGDAPPNTPPAVHAGWAAAPAAPPAPVAPAAVAAAAAPAPGATAPGPAPGPAPGGAVPPAPASGPAL